MSELLTGCLKLGVHFLISMTNYEYEFVWFVNTSVTKVHCPRGKFIFIILKPTSIQRYAIIIVE